MVKEVFTLGRRIPPSSGCRAGIRGVAAGLLLMAGVMLAPPLAVAQQHGIAMHGAPKYGPDMTAFPFVDPAAPKGGVLRLPLVGSFDSVNPFIVKGSPAWGPMLDHNRYLSKLVYESLLRRSPDEPFALYGLIAEGVEMAPDRSWIQFTLNPEARFHDGRPVTPEDVIFSLKTLREQGRPNHRLYYGQVDKAEILNDGQVRFTFGPDGNRELPLILGLLPILPAHFFQDRALSDLSLTPIPGTGPYRMETIDPGRQLVLTRDPAYWGADLPVNRGMFNFDRVVLDYFRDVTTAFEAVKSGAYDIWLETDPRRWAALTESDAAKSGDIVLDELPNGWPAPMRAFVFNTRKPLFTDARVRRALALAFDFEWVNANFFYGAFARTTSFFDKSQLAARGPASAAEVRVLRAVGAEDAALAQPPRTLPTAENQAALRRNLRQAARLLRQAGWRVQDGQLVKEETGAPFAFEILVADPQKERLALHFSRNLETLGIAATVRSADSAQYQARLDEYDFDMIVYRWDLSLSPGNELAFYFGSAAADTPGTRNYMGVTDPAIDRLIDKIVNAPTREDLVAAARALDRVLLAGDYVIPLYHAPSDWIARSRKIKRPETTPLEGYLIESWWATGD